MKNDYEVRGDVTAIFLHRKDGSVLEALINTTDLPKVASFQGNWYVATNRRANYVQGQVWANGKLLIQVKLHRFILDYTGSDVVDHINHDALNNKRSNLRIVTKAQNSQNRLLNRNNTTGARGVNWVPRKQRWSAQVRSNGKAVYCKFFACKSDAIAAVIKARAELMPFSEEL